VVAYDDFKPPDPRIDHLQLLQGVVNRLSNAQYILKGWAVAVVVAVLGFAFRDKDTLFALAAFAPLATFLAFDLYLLHKEHRYRDYFDQVRMSEANDAFLMAAPMTLPGTRPSTLSASRGGRRSFSSICQ